LPKKNISSSKFLSSTTQKNIMMQPSQQSSATFTPSIFEAIKNDDWEGMLATYAVTAYDAIHTPDVSGRGRRNSSRHMGHQQPLPSSLMAAMMDAGGPKRTHSFRDGKVTLCLTSSEHIL
jgi:hypothetical protein